VLRRVLLTASFGILLAIGLMGPSAAKPPLGPRGWAPGELSFAPSSALTSGLLAAAYVLGCAAVALALLRPPARAWTWRGTLTLAVVALLTGPFGSADHTNYAAYGRIAAQGGDPYLVAPEDWASGTDPVTSAVEPPWTETVSVYGPFATVLHLVSSLLGGDSMRQTVWVWQVITVLAWLAVRWVLLRAAADPVRVDVLWTANPVAFGIGVLGAHLDVPAAALALAALVLAARSPVAAGALTGLAVSTKITFGVVGLAVLLAWFQHDRRHLVRRAAAYVGTTLVVVIPLHLWAGPHVFEQLGRARRSVSLATPWRLAVDGLTGRVDPSTVRTLVFAASIVMFVVFATLLWRLTAGQVPDGTAGAAVRWGFVLSTAYAVAAPYSLPWYDQLTWAALPLLAASALDLVLLARLTVLGLAYVPGRVVAMTPDVQQLTLWFRRRVAPYLGLLVWLALTAVGRRGSRPTDEPRQAASSR
jgi:glycosyl transferase family 87